ncbi:GAF domain-containing protein [Deinococcus aerophilus]|uniref:histidine kinase n=1 Tax=Deinococcus aerophilus TaxID=522488 RepID=A0ABQ2GXZ8_9DEIO|nr:GAF domain-containing protein [Deinococcus aerophilus]GGM19162.1 hypothetical protein GCM10010841_29110 [Deinococcus aerophilus]
MSSPTTSLPSLSEHLLTLSETLVSASTQDQVLRVVLTTVTKALDAVVGTVLLSDERGEHLTLAACWDAGTDTWTSWPGQEGAAAEVCSAATHALERRETLFLGCGDARVEGEALDLRACTGRTVCTAVLPLVAGTQPLGAVVLDFQRPHLLTAEEGRFLRTVMAQSALAMARGAADLETGQSVVADARTQALEAERAALAAFARFTEVASTGTDPQLLAEHARDVLQSVLGEVHPVYYELEDGLWRARVVAADMDPVVVQAACDGFPGDLPSFQQPFAQGQAVFFEHWDAEREGVQDTGMYRAGAMYPFMRSGRPHGLLTLGLTQRHGWTERERSVFRAVGRSLTLALERAETAAQLTAHTLQIEASARAQAAFVAYSEAVGRQTDLPGLAQQAFEVLRGRFPSGSAGFYTREHGRWSLQARSEDVSDQNMTELSAGFSDVTPMIAGVLATRQPMFVDAVDVRQEPHTGPDGAGATLPLLVDGEVGGILCLGVRGLQHWSESDQAFVRAVGRGLTLALERAVQTQRLELQNAELDARTRALEGFADLTRDLTLHDEPYVLIKRAQQVVLSLLPAGYALYFERRGEEWILRAQTGELRSEALQAAVDAGLPYDTTNNLVIPFTTLAPYYQDQYARSTDNLDDMVGHIGASATLPVLVNGAPRGVFAVVLFGSERHWTRPDQAALESVVRSLGLALERAEGLAHLEASTREVGEWRERYEVAVRGSGHLLYDWNPATGQILYGGAVEQITGYAPQELTGTLADWTDRLIHPEDRDAFAQEIARVTRSGDDFHMAFRVVRRDGSVREVEDDGYFNRDAQGEVTRMAGLVKDVTERRQAERALRHANEELRRSNADLEQFAYVASHDLQAPIRAVTSFAGVIDRRYGSLLDDRGRLYLRQIVEGGEHMKRLVDDLLMFSRVHTQQRAFSVTDTGAVFDRVARRLQDEVQATGTDLSRGELPRVLGDEQQLDQLLQNLISNGMKYRREGVAPRIHVSAAREGRRWRFAVSDNGIGIERQYFERVFVIFQRLHGQEEYEGTGIGLAVCKKIVERHGGQIGVESTPGQGSTFSFTLPAE